MENYIVRIYGRDPDDSDRVTGILESVEHETRRPFHSLDGLRSMLDIPAAGDSKTEDLRGGAEPQAMQSHLTPRLTRRADH